MPCSHLGIYKQSFDLLKCCFFIMTHQHCVFLLDLTTYMYVICQYSPPKLNRKILEQKQRNLFWNYRKELLQSQRQKCQLSWLTWISSSNLRIILWTDFKISATNMNLVKCKEENIINSSRKTFLALTIRFSALQGLQDFSIAVHFKDN